MTSDEQARRQLASATNAQLMTRYHHTRVFAEAAMESGHNEKMPNILTLIEEELAARLLAEFDN